MRRHFANTTPVTISAGPPSTVTSPIEVNGVDGATVEDVDVKLDIDHTWDGDLNISLVNPSGQRVVLVNRRGGRNDHFHQTAFDSDAPISILNAAPPYTGTFRPEGNLEDFRGRPAAGTWRLEVRDREFQDGGKLNSWSLSIATTEPTTSGFEIDVRFLGGLTPAQEDAFGVAAARWSK